LAKLIKRKYPEGFDIFLDDGSHVPEHQFTTFVHMWSAIRPSGVLMIEDVQGINPLLKWILEGHKVDKSAVKHASLSADATGSALEQGLYYPGGEVGDGHRVSSAKGDNLNHWGGFPSGEASKVQNEVESVKIYPYVLAITKRKEPLKVLEAPNHGTQWLPRRK